MSDVFDIDNRSCNKKNYTENYKGGWMPVDANTTKIDKGRKRYSPKQSEHRQSISPVRKTQMYNQQYQQGPPAMYSEQQYNQGYGQTQQPYQTTYPQQYQQQNRNQNNFNQYNQQQNYQPTPQGYNTGPTQPGPPGEEYPAGSWTSVSANYSNSMNHPVPPPVQRASSVSSTTHGHETKDEMKKEAIAQELKQQRATLLKQREEYLRKAGVLRRELEKLRVQKHELLSEKSPPRDSQRILRENGKLQLEIQNKLKSINNVVDMLSGIIGDGMKTSDEDVKVSLINSRRGHLMESDDESARSVRASHSEKEDEWPKYNYVHYDPELHWCRVCDVFPTSAKDYLNHLHSTEHRKVTQEHQLVDTPWHKLPGDAELPSCKSGPVKRIPIKGLQFFISATAWYCKLCDVWIGDLHCASAHLKSKNHAHNYSNFVEQNPHWETNWVKDRETAYARCLKNKQKVDPMLPSLSLDHSSHMNEKSKSNSKNKHSDFLEALSGKEKKRKKKSKKRKRNSSGSSSSSSSSSNSSSEDESDKAKSIRVAMRNKMRMQAQLILNEEIGGKLEALGKLVEERNRKKGSEEKQPIESIAEDNIINQWMTINPQNDKLVLENLKGRLKQKQRMDEEKAMEVVAEQRRKEREREEKEIKEREQREMEERLRVEQEKEERERFKERERFRRRRRSDSRSPEVDKDRRSRSRSNSRYRNSNRYRAAPRSPDRYYRDERRNDPQSPGDKYKPPKHRGDYDDEKEESPFDKQRKHSSSSSSKKLPFIGRMPPFKKKPEVHNEEHKSSSKKKEDYQIRLSKFESGITARAFIPEPGVVHITKLATPPSINLKLSAENPPPPPKIIPEPPNISEPPPPPPPIINNVVTTVEEPEIQDMELDGVAPIPPGVPPAEAKPIVRPAGNHLPRDFQEALNIIFPGDQRPDLLSSQTDPNLLLQYQYGMGYGMMYPGMQLYDYNSTQDEISEENKDDQIPEPPPPPSMDDKEDLAMLGIDEEDMAAQNF